MTGHRERLIACGLVKPLTHEEECKRNGLLARMSDGEKISSYQQPIFCVFRSDNPYTHVISSDEKRRCRDAELIADKLTHYEASNLCTRLNWHDEKLPLTHEKSLYRQALYKYCTHDDWEEWKNRSAQTSIFDILGRNDGDELN